MKLGLAFTTIVLLGSGCNRQTQTPCQVSLDAVLQRSVSVPDEDADTVREMDRRLAEQLAKLCTEDRWSAPMLECLDAADDAQSARACSSKLSVSQSEHLIRLMNALTGLPAQALQRSLTGSGT